MPITVEDTVAHLLKPPLVHHVESSDRKTLTDIRAKTWWANKPITVKQQNLVCKLVSRYLLLLKQHKWPVDDLLDPRWDTPVSDPPALNNWQAEYNHHTNQFHIRFPYSQSLSRLLRNITSSPFMIDALDWDSKESCYKIENGIQGRQVVRHLLTEPGPWFMSKETREMVYATNTDAEPTVKYINGQWQHEGVTPTLAQAIDQVLEQELDLVTMAFQLSKFEVKFDHTVRNALRPWLTDAQISILCNNTSLIEMHQLGTLTSLIEQVNQWPVLVIQPTGCTNRLEFSSPVSHQIYTSESVSRSAAALHFKQALSSKERKQIIVDFDSHKTLAKEIIRVPWVVHLVGFTATHAHDVGLPDARKYHLYNSDRYIKVAK
jgi:hypothetical protein